MSYYPYGAMPHQSYQVQPGVRTNPMGYAAPVAQANPFSALVLAHGMKNAFGGSTSSDPDVSIVTWDSYLDIKDFSKDKLGASDKDLGKPLGLKYKDCDLVIPLPSKKKICSMVNNQLKAAGHTNLSDKEKKDYLRRASKNLAIDYYAKCTYEDDLDAAACNPFMPDAGNTTRTGDPTNLGLNYFFGKEKP